MSRQVLGLLSLAIILALGAAFLYGGYLTSSWALHRPEIPDYDHGYLIPYATKRGVFYISSYDLTQMRACYGVGIIAFAMAGVVEIWKRVTKP